MRGVYPPVTCTPFVSRGSSPHARGLPSVAGWPDPSARIIPACAGFTAGRGTPAAPCRDHPRMRGVYRPHPGDPAMTAGSSPHARGLPSRLRWTRLTRRIIPACAGFTGRRTPRKWPTRDHPRMRGVYSSADRARSLALGSSPHARGLPREREREAHRAWIIPACAGFTLRPRPGDPAARIIPACAGFTDRGRPVYRVPGDHPRMRGVYQLRVTGHAADRGSSPHARGLRPRDGDGGDDCGIIPACAGFTSERAP